MTKMVSKKITGLSIALVAVIVVGLVANYYLERAREVELTTKTLIWGTTESPEGAVDPATSRGYCANVVVTQIYEGLVSHRVNTSEIVPALATNWEVIDDTTWEFKLRKGVYFHDGTPFNASCVKFSINRTITGKQGIYNYIAPVIESVEVVDDYTVRLHLYGPNWGLLALLARSCSMIVSPTAVNKYGENYASEGVTGTGPFKLVYYHIGVEMLLEANDKYWNSKRIPKIDKLIVRFFKDSATLKLALEVGSIDVAHRHIGLADIPDLKAKPNIKTISASDIYCRVLFFSWNHTYTKELLVRQAIAYAIDYDAICELRGGVRAYSVVDPLMYPELVADAQKMYYYNTSKARDLLAQAGYPNGIPDKLELWYTPANYGAEEAEMVALIQSNLKAVGIDVDLKSSDYTTMLGFIRKNLCQMFAMGYSQGVASFDQIASFLYSDGVGYSLRLGRLDPEGTAIADAARVERDPEKRAELYRQLQELVDPQLPGLWLYRPLNYMFVGDYVYGEHLGMVGCSYPIDFTLFYRR